MVSQKGTNPACKPGPCTDSGIRGRKSSLVLLQAQGLEQQDTQCSLGHHVQHNSEESSLNIPEISWAARIEPVNLQMLCQESMLSRTRIVPGKPNARTVPYMQPEGATLPLLPDLSLRVTRKSLSSSTGSEESSWEVYIPEETLLLPSGTANPKHTSIKYLISLKVINIYHVLYPHSSD